MAFVIVGGTPKNGNVESSSPCGAIGVSRWQIAKSAAEIKGAMSANIAEKPCAFRCARATSGLWGKMSPAKAMVMVVSCGVAVSVAAVVHAETINVHANSAVRFTLLI
jgi:hypothetical protein